MSCTLIFEDGYPHAYDLNNLVTGFEKDNASIYISDGTTTHTYIFPKVDDDSPGQTRTGIGFRVTGVHDDRLEVGRARWNDNCGTDHFAITLAGKYAFFDVSRDGGGIGITDIRPAGSTPSFFHIEIKYCSILLNSHETNSEFLRIWHTDDCKYSMKSQVS